MSNNKKNDKFKREQCRQEIAKQYNDEIRALNEEIKRLREEKIISSKLIEEQQKKIDRQEEQLNLYKMVVNMPESEIIKLMNQANTKNEFLEAVHQINNIFKLY